MTHGDLAGMIDYDGMQRAIEAQLLEQGWGDVHAEAGKDRLVIEAVHLGDAVPGWVARALREGTAGHHSEAFRGTACTPVLSHQHSCAWRASG